MSYISHPVQKSTSYPMGEADGSHLSELEREWLDMIPEGFSMTSKASVDYMNDTRTAGEKAAEWTPARLGHETVVIAYIGEFGMTMGAVRSAYRFGDDVSYEASPFPGAWERVAVSRILLVRHAQTI
jgi:hypothetical protein